ncbi:MAG: hypothetical protein JHC71_06640 [Blastococcus sp.]|nr:hypothetical protein [Blastococcus sp.]
MSDTPRTVSSARELLEITTLHDIVWYELSGRRLTDDEVAAAPEPAGEEDAPLQVMARSSDEEIEVRVRTTTQSPSAVFSVDVGALFSLATPVDIDPDAMKDFVQRVGVMAAYPFVREGLFSVAARMRVEAPLLQLLQSNTMNLVSAPAE